MTNKIEEFLNDKFGTVGAVKQGNVIWFVASDVSKILGYRMASDMTRLLDDDEKGTHSLRTRGGEQEVTIINESGLYSVVLSITKRNKERYALSREFKKWITNEVLPTLRETGAYIETNREQEVVDKYFFGLSDDLKLAVFKELQTNNEQLQVKVDKYDQVLDIESTHTFTEVAKILSTRAKEVDYDFTISPSHLTKYLRDNGILSKAKSKGEYTNAPIKKYENYFDVIVRTINSEKTKAQTRVKMNGIDFIFDLLKGNNFTLFV